ncbi:hypothetical protein AAG747_05670 [Rapidithrix thailandica]|uniref:Uncharacterized protein n=1 Tax=Rapidithrix thailandica TaxID=413964 RepID=A0AAW9S4T9_9BACT
MMIKLNWIIESFSVVNEISLTVEDIALNKNLVGSFDYLGMEGYDNFLMDPNTHEIVYLGLGVPQNFLLEKSFFETRKVHFDKKPLEQLFLKKKCFLRN